MAQIRSPLPVKLFVGILTSIPEIIPEAESKLAGLFGAVDSRSQQFLFDSTHYYDETMGSPIFRHFFSFADLIQASAIADAKVKTNDLESDFAGEHPGLPRPVNLDPGYVEQSKIVLASTKNFYHRILVSSGIYAEVTLHFEAGEWRSFPWTFPDYKTDRYHPFFSSLRELYRSQLKARGFRIR
jgi:N-methylhydantoinase B/oxoprolinase/acetone carboxylase alpha subunit